MNKMSINKMSISKIFILTMNLLLLAGCSSVSPPTHYYLLSQDLGSVTKVDNLKPPVYLTSVTLADYLNQSALVMMVGEQEAQVATYHFWGERLNKAVSRVLTHDLEEACLCRVLDNQLADEPPKNAVALSLHIEQLASTAKGQVLLAGRYRITKNKKQTVYRFRYLQAMEGTGFQPAIATKRALIAILANEISATLSD